MKNNLNNMPLKELWRLFPIIIEKHNPVWTDYFNEEKDFLLNIGRNCFTEIHHIGSTAVSGLAAKPIIDIITETNATVLISLKT